MPLTQRQQSILSAVIQSYSKKNHPVASNDLVVNYKFGYSPATIRAEMMRLEKKGFLEKPHVSSGRIPTDKGYRFYIRELMVQRDLKKREKERLKQKISQIDYQTNFAKELAEILADFSKNLALVGTDAEEYLYFAGLPELVEKLDDDMFWGIARFLEQAEKNFERFFYLADEEPSIFIGRENPFLRHIKCGLILTRCYPGQHKGIIGLLGPNRMDYEHSLSLLDYVNELLD